MSFSSSHFEFMQPVQTAHDLDLPHFDVTEIDGQMFDLRPGDRLTIYSADLQRYAEVRFKEWLQLTRNSRKVAVFVRLETNEQINISNAGLRALEKALRIQPIGRNGTRVVPGAWMSLPEADREAARRAMFYVDRYYRYKESVGTRRGPSRELTKAFLAEVAEERGEPPPSYEWLHKMIARDRDGTRFDRAMNFARKPRRGNETPRLPTLIHEALEIAAHLAWSQPDGDYKTLREHFIGLMMNDERFASVRHLGIKDSGASLISKSTFDERLASVDKYTRDLLRYGAERAALENQQFIRIHRPQCLMDIVDVDHLKTDLFAYLDENPLAFGRLDLIVFRERMSGVILAAVPSFGDPSYSTFARGLELAIFGMEGQLRAGVSWPWFGLFNKLGVDNAMHFIGDSIGKAAVALEFDIIEHRPARPGDKGALERFLGTITRDVFHMLPGTTMESPKIREMFGEDRDMAVPLLALSEVETVIQHWIANVYHREPRQGLGGDLTTTEGVPAELWTKHEASIPRRPLLDRTIFTRLAGKHENVTVQKDGVRAHGVIWNAPGLLALSLHPKTRRAVVGRKSTKFDMHINPFNIAQAWVVDPYRNEVIEVQAVGPNLDYCTNLSFDVHKMIQAYRAKEAKEKREVPSLLKARQTMHQILVDLINQNRKKMSPHGKLAKFIQRHFVADRRRKTLELAHREQDGSYSLAPGMEVHTNFHTVPFSTTDEASPAAQMVVVETVPPKKRGRRMTAVASQASPPVNPVSPPAPDDNDDDDDDIDAILARNPDWKK
jgi:putative transposase